MPDTSQIITELAVLSTEVKALRLSIDAEHAFQKQRLAELQKDVDHNSERIDTLEKRSERQLGWGAALIFAGGVIAWVIDHWDKLFHH